MPAHPIEATPTLRDGSAVGLSSPTTAVGVFDDYGQAAQAIDALKRVGFTDAQIGIASREFSERFANVRVQEQDTAGRGAAAGAAVGGGIGAAVGLVGAVLVPGLLPLVAGQLIVSALVGGAAGAALGSFAGPFIAMGFSEADAEQHARSVEQGKAVLIVHAGERKDEARDVMSSAGAYDPSTTTSP